MIEYAEFIHYSVVAASVALSSIGVGLGQGLTGIATLKAIDRQPSSKTEIIKISILGMTLMETAAVMGTFVALFMLFGASNTSSSYSHLASLGIGFAIGLPSLFVGLFSTFPTQEACIAAARQPFDTQKILRFMLITLSIIQTPVIFALLIALFIQGQASTVTTMRDVLRLIAAGLSIGIGSVGPAIGLALFGKSANKGMGINRNAQGKILAFTFISQAIIETPIILTLIISFWLLFAIQPTNTENILDGIAFIAAGLCSGIGTIGVGISSGRTSAVACKQITEKPELYPVISRASLFAQGLIETCAIYPWLIALLIVLFQGS